MRIRLKALDRQVMVITGATSGIGLATARAAAGRGAKLVLAARNEDALRQLCDELQLQGHEAAYAVADVGRRADVERIADVAFERFGGFDTWVNNAGTLIYGRIEEVSDEDAKRLFDTNFWGVWHGSRIALRHLKRHGGALINVGSDLSEHTAPLMGPYSASKHAVMGLTDALRVEVHQQRAPVAVTLIRPSGIDTQIRRHARNYMDVEPRLPPPVYAPEVVADAILHAAEHQTRDLFAGGAARVLSTLTHLGPLTSDWVMRRLMFGQLRSDKPAQHAEGALHETMHSPLQERGGSERHVFKRSVYTKLAMHPRASRVAGYGLAAAAALALYAHRGMRLRRS